MPPNRLPGCVDFNEQRSAHKINGCLMSNVDGQKHAENTDSGDMDREIGVHGRILNIACNRFPVPHGMF